MKGHNIITEIPDNGDKILKVSESQNLHKENIRSVIDEAISSLGSSTEFVRINYINLYNI